MNRASAGKSSIRTLDWLVATGLTGLALALYVSTLAPGVLEADAGEFQFVAWLPGIAHPTGYPLYILLGYAWTHLLPVGEVAWRMNLLSAVLAALAVGLTFGVARQLLDMAWNQTPGVARVIAAAVAAATFAVTHTFWSQALVAEVYALHTLLFAAILWLALRYRNQDDRPNPGHWSGKLLAFTLGLSLAHHVTTVLILPGLVLYLWVSRPRDRRQAEAPGSDGAGRRAFYKRLATYCLLFLAPLLLYLYLPITAPATPYARLAMDDTQPLILYDNSLQGFIRHVSGTVFAGQLQPTALQAGRFSLVEGLLRQQVGLVGVVLALIGVVGLWRQRKFDLLLLTGLIFLAFVGFNLIYLIGDVFVLFIPAWLIVCLWLGAGCLALTNWLANAFVRQKMDRSQSVVFERLRDKMGFKAYRWLMVMLGVFFFVLPIVLFTMRNPEVSQTNNTTASTRWQKILAEPIPTASILLSNDRNEIMPMWYFQLVEGRRSDLLGLFPLIVPETDYANIGRVLDQALASGRPVYLIKSMDGLELKTDVEPEGILYRARPLDPAPVHAVDMTLPAITVPLPGGNNSAQESIRLVGYDLESAEASPGDEVTVTLYWQITKDLVTDYTSFVHLISADDRRIAQSDHRPGGNFYPSSLWRTGEILRDEHRLSIPVDATAGAYRLRIGMYYQPAPDLIKGMGDGLEIGTLVIEKSEPVSIIDASTIE